MNRVILFIILVGAPVSVWAQQATKYYVADEEVSAKISVRPPSKKSSGPSISRSFANSDEEHLLNIAEAVYSSRAEVLRATRLEIKMYARPVSDKNLWWCESFDGVLIPYAITKSAINYYVMLMEEFRKGDFSRTGGIKMSSMLNYSASIQRQDSYQAGKENFQAVYVVSMHLAWRQYCGMVCAMRFEKERTVVLDSKGNVLYVGGDECPVPAIS